jgi:hypothetical protein
MSYLAPLPICGDCGFLYVRYLALLRFGVAAAF